MNEKNNEGKHQVRCILVNYRSPWEMLKRCIDSIMSDSGEIACAVTLVDNASGDDVIHRVASAYPQVQIVEMTKNAGFAAAVNRGLREVTEPYVLLLNTDALLAGGALDFMADALSNTGGDVAGVAPKMMSSVFDGVIDAVGTVMPPNGASFNRGIGQCDLGQYDAREDVFGLCFGAALLRTELFRPDKVGPLYENYFLYFEDSDWCMRARSQGYRFLTAPASVVKHFHSATTRKESLAFKYRLIELNTLRIVVRNFEDPLRVARIVVSRASRLIARTVIRRRFIVANLSTLGTFLAEFPRLLRERKALKRLRIVSDRKIFEMAKDEDAYFDTVEYRPCRVLDSLIDAYLRLLKNKKDPGLGKTLALLYQWRQMAATGEAPPLELREALLSSQPPCVRELLELPTSSWAQSPIRATTPIASPRR